MALIAIQCKNCGGVLRVDPAAANYVCPHCHTAYAMEQTINQTFQTTNIANATIIDDGSGVANQEIKSAEACLSFRDYWFARRKFEDMSERYAHMYQVWWGLARAITEDFTADLTGKSELDRMTEALDHALALAPADEKEKIRLTTQPYRTRWESHRETLREERDHQLDLIEERRLQQLPPIEKKIEKLKASRAHRENKVKRAETIGTIVPFSCSALVLVVMIVSLFGNDIGFFNFVFSAILYALIAIIVFFLPLTLAAYVIVKAISVSAGVEINRYNREINRLDEEGGRILNNLTEEVRAVGEKTCWLQM